MKKTLSLMLCLMLALGSLAVLAAETPYADGTYTGEALGYHTETPIKVTVTVTDGKIADVKIDSHEESPGIADAALVEVPQAIVEANGIDVVVSATAKWTIQGIKDAVAAALATAPAPEAEAPAEEVAEAPAEEVAEAPEGALADGVYTGEALGYHTETPIKVTVTVTDGKIAEVKIDSHEESPGIADAALVEVPQAIVEANGIDVVVSATAKWTIQGIKDAVAAALATTPAPEAEAPAEEVAEAPEGALADGVYTGEAIGYHTETPIKVTVTVTDGKIADVKIDSHEESAGIADAALVEVPQAIVDANSPDVVVSATAKWTIQGIIDAVKAALANAGYVEEVVEEVSAEPLAISGSNLTLGLGIDNSGRIGPGKDNKDVQVYSFNQVFAAVIFDAEGKIVFAKLDQLEVASPNYDGEGMPHFAGFPGQLPYTYDENHDGEIDGVMETNDELFQSDIAGWMTKRERGEAYKMGLGTWASQMDAYEAFFVGKTVEELEALFERVFSSRNGRPLKDGSTNEEDKAKYDALSEEDKALLADVVTGATMSLNDSHGNILAALKAAYETRVPVTTSAAALGLGMDFTGRLGPGKDNTETQVYSMNQVVTVNLFDAEGKIVQSLVDQIEVATPNYDGAGMPHFSGFPGQGGYNYDVNHDGVVDGRFVPNSEGFLGELASWATKRERGNDYKMGLGSWASEMDAYQAFFVGKSVEELNELFERVFSSRNGRPLQDGSKNEEDKAKYDALSEEDKDLLADVVTGATMSLNDSHGNILAALQDSLNKKVDVAITLGE